MDVYIQPLLDTIDLEEEEGEAAGQTVRNTRTQSPLSTAAERRAQAAGSTSSSGFQTRGARFFIGRDTNIYE